MVCYPFPAPSKANKPVIKQRMQIRNSPHRTVMACARSVYRSEGLAAFYVSYPTTITMTVPFTAVQFSAYEFLKGVLNPDGGYSPMTHVTAGGIAGGIAAAVTTPLDVAKVSLCICTIEQVADLTDITSNSRIIDG
jgi:solute carrier family 25 iron transporter 28/37